MLRSLRVYLSAVVGSLCVLASVMAQSAEERSAEADQYSDKKEPPLPVDGPLPHDKKEAKPIFDPKEVQAEAFVDSRKFDSLKKLDEQIVNIQRLLQAVPSDHPDRAEFEFNLSELYWHKSKFYEQKAFETQDECYALQDRNEKKSKVKGCQRRMNAQLREATRLREKVIELYLGIIQNHASFKNLADVYFYLGSSLADLSRRSESLEVFRKMIAQFPQSRFIPNVLVAFGDYYFDANEMEQALKAYEKVITTYTESPVYGYALYRKAWCQFNLDEKEKSLDLFLGVMRHALNYPKLPNSKALLKQSRKDLVLVYSFVGRPSKALPFFKKISSGEREVWLRMGERLALLYSDKGKYQEAIRLYRRLIKEDKKSVRVLNYQYEIVRNQSSLSLYSKETIREIVALMALLKLGEEGKFRDRQQHEESYQKFKSQIEEASRRWALTFHREARQTQNLASYTKAYQIYRFYLKVFQDSPNLYTMGFFYGELLYHLERWEEAAKAYETAWRANPTGSYTEDIMHSTVLAYFKLLGINDKRANIEKSVGKTFQKTDQDGDKAKRAIPAQKKIPDLQRRFAEACQRYIEYAPKGERIVDVKYTLARIYYDHFHLQKAADLFEDIAYKHHEHRLAVVAANLHLDSLNLFQDYDRLERDVASYREKKPIEDENFQEELRILHSAISFKKCTIYDQEEKWGKAADCFVSFCRNFSQSEHVDTALYNAALDFERQREIGKAIKVRTFLVQVRPESKFVPITLYNIAANYHALAVYSQAAKLYEGFVNNFPRHEKARSALTDASTFRHGLGQYDLAIADYEKYLSLYGKKKSKRSAEVFFQIAKNYEKKKDMKKAIKHYEIYLKKYRRKGTPDHRLEAHLKIGLFYWNKRGKPNRAKALKEFKKLLKVYKSFSKSVQEEMTKGRDAAAHARFMIGTDVLEQMEKIKIDSPNPRVLGKRTKAKLKVLGKAKKVFEDVIKFKRPDWAIAALYRIGFGMVDLAENFRNSQCPRKLTYDQCEIYKGKLEDVASNTESGAVSYFEKALETARQASWFNKYTKQAEVMLAQLRPREYRAPSEIRAMPDHFDPGFGQIGFITTLVEEDQLSDFGEKDIGMDAAMPTGPEKKDEKPAAQDASLRDHQRPSGFLLSAPLVAFPLK